MSATFYRTISLEISGPDEALVGSCAIEVEKAVKKLTDQQLKRSAVRVSNQCYCTSTKPAPDLNCPLNRKAVTA